MTLKKAEIGMEFDNLTEWMMFGDRTPRVGHLCKKER